MTLGKKIKKLRTEKKITQSRLCSGKITRNMLSEIECDKASPSLGTLSFIADRLGVSLSYLLSDDDSSFYYEKKDKINEIKKHFSLKEYQKCIDLTLFLKETDDELAYILAHCYFEIARKRILDGSLNSGYNNLQKSMEFCQKTIYDTSRIKNLTIMYSALSKNIQSPLLEFDSQLFSENLDLDFDYEFYKYLIQDYSHSFSSPIFSKHIAAKDLMKTRKYREAIDLLTEVENLSKTNYNAHVVFSVYSDLESCYKQIVDFESAYRYASKRLSLIEGFKT